MSQRLGVPLVAEQRGQAEVVVVVVVRWWWCGWLEGRMGPKLTAYRAQSSNQSKGLVMCHNVFVPLVAEGRNRGGGGGGEVGVAGWRQDGSHADYYRA
jgi:hypothetical protein